MTYIIQIQSAKWEILPIKDDIPKKWVSLAKLSNVQALELHILPGSTVYWLWTLGRLLNVSVPHFSHFQKGIMIGHTW